MRPRACRSAQVRRTSAGAGGQLSSLCTGFMLGRACEHKKYILASAIKRKNIFDRLTQEMLWIHNFGFI